MSQERNDIVANELKRLMEYNEMLLEENRRLRKELTKAMMLNSALAAAKPGVGVGVLTVEERRPAGDHFRDVAKMVEIVEKMRKAFEKIIAIEGYGAPWIEAKTIAQNALEIALPDGAIAQKPEPFGNTAKLRWSVYEQKRILHEAFWGDGHIRGSVLIALRNANLALAAPARNVDRRSTHDECWKLFRDETHGCPSDEAFIEWLFDEADGGDE